VDVTDQPSLPESHSLTDYVEDGARIATILLVVYRAIDYHEA
jgi:hypothetical protein